MAKRRVINISDHRPSGAESYRFIDKDPIIDEMMFYAKQDGRSLTALAIQAYLSPTTVSNWYKGKTKKPNHVSVKWFLRAMGYDYVAVKTTNKLPVYRWRTSK